MKTLKLELPFKWPFPAKAAKPQPKRKAKGSPPASARPSFASQSLTPKGKIIDVILVIFWGASIPGVMWLAAAGGF